MHPKSEFHCNIILLNSKMTKNVEGSMHPKSILLLFIMHVINQWYRYAWARYGYTTGAAGIAVHCISEMISALCLAFSSHCIAWYT